MLEVNRNYCRLRAGKKYAEKAVERLKRLVYRYGPASFVLESEEGECVLTLIATSGIADADVLMPRVVLIAIFSGEPSRALHLEQKPIEVEEVQRAIPEKSEAWCESVVDLLDMLVV